MLTMGNSLMSTCKCNYIFNVKKLELVGIVSVWGGFEVDSIDLIGCEIDFAEEVTYYPNYFPM